MDNQWVRLDGQGNALNMEHVAQVEVLEDGKVGVRLMWGGTLVLEKDDARRVLAWLKEHAELTPM